MSGIEQTMPILPFIQLLLMFCQAVFYLRLDDDRAKFLTLFSKALSDAGSFIIIYLLISFLAAMSLFVLGGTYDDGSNFEDDYDTDFNEYPQMLWFGVYIIGVLRTSIGDI